jgi:hypothetical protein
MKELWKDIEGYEGLYQVSNMGRVKALAKKTKTWTGTKSWPERILKPIIQHSGYAHVGLWRQQKCKQSRVHRLVAAAFCMNDDPVHKTQVNHLNENKLDNRASNLCWATPQENTCYGTGIARRIYGRERAVECYSSDGVVERFRSQAEANAWCGIARNDGHIAACCKGRQKTAYGYRWRYIEEVMSDGSAEAES